MAVKNCLFGGMFKTCYKTTMMLLEPEYLEDWTNQDLKTTVKKLFPIFFFPISYILEALNQIRYCINK